jgi:hypothetical protein
MAGFQISNCSESNPFVVSLSNHKHPNNLAHGRNHHHLHTHGKEETYSPGYALTKRALEILAGLFEEQDADHQDKGTNQND